MPIDSGLRRSYDPRMRLWRCPHCGTPQPESSRCWLCRRSTTSCAACRHYRRGVAGGLGLCGLSKQRLALRGTEVLPCWEGVPQFDDAEPPRDRRAGDTQGGAAEAGLRPHRTFVPVDELRAASREPQPPPVAGAGPAEPAARWSLWGDAEV